MCALPKQQQRSLKHAPFILHACIDILQFLCASHKIGGNIAETSKHSRFQGMKNEYTALISSSTKSHPKKVTFPETSPDYCTSALSMLEQHRVIALYMYKQNANQSINSRKRRLASDTCPSAAWRPLCFALWIWSLQRQSLFSHC
jgi:hypothetical protein